MGNGPKGDTSTKAKETCTDILDDLRVRSIISAMMCYDLSSTYDSKSSIGTIGVSVLMGIVGRRIPMVAGRFWLSIMSKSGRRQYGTANGNGMANGTGIERVNQSQNGTANGYNDLWSKVKEFAGSLIVPMTISGITLSVGSRFLFEEWKAKEKAYNEAGAAWQRLELDIRRFLAVSDKDTTALEKYNEVTGEFTRRREEICLIARPEKKVYDKYHDMNDPDNALDKCWKKIKVNAEMRKAFAEQEQTKNI